MNPVRSAIAVLSGVAIVSLVVEPLELTLVRAVADGPITNEAEYFAIRNRPGILVVKIVSTTLAGILAGYVTAKVAGTNEMTHASFAASLQTLALVNGMLSGPSASSTPVWVWIGLILLTGPAILLGASIRAAARAPASPPPRRD